MPKTLWLTLAGAAVMLLTLYALVLAWLWWQQESLLFFPERLPADYPLAQAPDVHELAVPVEGATLSVLHLKLPAPKGVALFLHGNAGNLAGWFGGEVDFWRRANFDLVMPDYRGYGKSSERVRSAGELRADLRAVWAAVAPAYRDRRVVFYGRSLGSALAAELAAEETAAGRPPDLTVLVSPYASLRQLARELYPWVPGALLRYDLDTERVLPRVGGQVLLLHGAQDRLLPPSHARRLAAVRPGSELVLVPSAGHNDLHYAALYERALLSALASL